VAREPQPEPEARHQQMEVSSLCEEEANFTHVAVFHVSPLNESTDLTRPDIHSFSPGMSRRTTISWTHLFHSSRLVMFCASSLSTFHPRKLRFVPVQCASETLSIELLPQRLKARAQAEFDAKKSAP